MKNRLSDLNDHLFAAIERLSEEGLSPEAIEAESRRGVVIASLADQVIRNAALRVQAAKIASDHGIDPSTYMRSLEHKE